MRERTAYRLGGGVGGDRLAQVTTIRPFRSGDGAALAAICLRTADSGGDATGVLEDDDLWAKIFLLPYLARHPDLAFVVERDNGSLVGYVVGAPDTREFEDWFHDEWWAERGPRWARTVGADGADSRQDRILAYADARRGGVEPYGDDYPAHLHIDLLPEAQGEGWGRQLIETLVAALRVRGVTGLHLVAGADNVGAVAFYPRVGFTPLPSPEGVQAFGLSLG